MQCCVHRLVTSGALLLVNHHCAFFSSPCCEISVHHIIMAHRSKSLYLDYHNTKYELCTNHSGYNACSEHVCFQPICSQGEYSRKAR